MSAEAASQQAAAAADLEARYWRTTLSIAAAAGVGSLSFNFWWPFVPLFLLDLGAKSDAEAVFWVSVASIAQGVTRLVTGPLWGVLSDKFGRKIMLLRALYFGTGTTLIAAFIMEPWQIAIAFGFQGVFSGFIPASVALTSVSVPDSKLNSSLSLVTGAQYLGSTLGPALGAAMAIAFGYRGAILVAAALPSIIATVVLFVVPADKVTPSEQSEETGEKQELEPFSKSLSLQFALVIFLFFTLFTLTLLLRQVTPIALKAIDPDSAVAISGLTFTVGGLASALAVIVAGQKFFKQGNLRTALAIGAMATGGAHLILAFADTVPLFVVGFAVISLLEAAMIPPTNTLIAANVSRERRGTAFGIAGSAQAIAFMAGPIGAAAFVALSLDLGFIVIGGLFLGLGALLFTALREPAPKEQAAATEA
ncbi:MAG: MFS transporter [Dehalococcoidia bacterium]|nr:MFS transporter [Dehalococcoidia bacterium]